MKRSQPTKSNMRQKRKRRDAASLKRCARVAATLVVAGLLSLSFLFFTETGRRVGARIPYFDRLYACLFLHPKVPYADGYGIDISHFQGPVDWARIGQIPYNLTTRRQGRDEATASVSIGFVMVKATEGATHLDATCADNIKAARLAGFLAGAYHVMTTSDPNMQADNFIANSGIVKGDMAPVIDLEESILGGNNTARAQKVLKVLVRRLETHYGTKPIIYCSHNFSATLNFEKAYADYPLWVARYGSDVKPEAADFWQFTDDGRIPGVKGPVDLDAFYCKRFKLSDLVVKK